MTKYYVKTFECIFPFYWMDEVGDSVNSMITAYLDTTKFIKTKVGQTLRFQDQQIFFLGAPTTPSIPPINAPIRYINMQNLPGEYFVWDDKRLDTFLGFSGASWAAGGRNWTNPDVDYATWQQEVAAYIEDAKTGNAEWGTEYTGGINVYIIKYRYYEQPSNSPYAYFVFFYKGNNPLRDLEIVI